MTVAPEVMNREAYGESVDLWGIGCIGYEMMTLDFLWEKKGILAASVHKTPMKPEALPDRFSYLRKILPHKHSWLPHRCALEFEASFFCIPRNAV